MCAVNSDTSATSETRWYLAFQVPQLVLEVVVLFLLLPDVMLYGAPERHGNASGLIANFYGSHASWLPVALSIAASCVGFALVKWSRHSSVRITVLRLLAFLAIVAWMLYDTWGLSVVSSKLG